MSEAVIATTAPAAAAAPSTETALQSGEAAPQENAEQKTAPNVDELVRGAHKKFEDAAKMREEAKAERAAALKEKQAAEDILSRLEADPSYLDERPAMKKKLEDYFVKQLAKEYELEQLDPKDRELKELRERETKREEQERLAREAQEIEAANVQAVAYAERLEVEMVEALTGSGLPQTTKTVALMAKKKLEALELGYNPDYAELVEEVREEYDNEFSWKLGEYDTLPDDIFLERIGLDRARRISRAYVARLKGTQAAKEAEKPEAKINALKQRGGAVGIDELRTLSDKERFELLHGK